MNKVLILLAGLVLSVSALAQTDMVVRIEANGELITDGEGPVVLGGVDTSEYASALSYGWSGEVNSQDSGQAAARNKYGPLRIVKPLARSSVLLRKALDQNQRIDVTLSAFAPDGDGGIQEVYRIEVTDGRVAGIRPFSDGQTGQYLEEVRFAWSTIEFTDVQTETSHVIDFPIAP
jgi:type VI secretion system Hcp family effector